MINTLLKDLQLSLTPYHAVKRAAQRLEDNGFIRLDENRPWDINMGGSYYTVKDGSALIAFKVGGEFSYNIIASHTDSPCLKLKLNAQNASAGCTRLNVERYGGGLNYTWMDVPLKIAGRVVYSDGGKLSVKCVELDRLFVIPSVAIHFNRSANDGIKLNPQTDMQVLASLGTDAEGLKKSIGALVGGEVLDYDLFVSAATQPYLSGLDEEFVCSPRIDNLSSAFASVQALIDSKPRCISMIYLADNEEVGSRTKQGAGSTFLKDVTRAIATALNKTEDEYRVALAKSFMLSCDNAHAVHPNHPELSDPTNKVLMGGGVVIKHHANGNYTTDALSSAIIKSIFKKAGVNYCDFFMRSDLPCGGTLGAISSSQLSIRSADIGLAQLAMHSSCETLAKTDYITLIAALTAFAGASIDGNTFDGVEVTV